MYLPTLLGNLAEDNCNCSLEHQQKGYNVFSSPSMKGIDHTELIASTETVGHDAICNAAKRRCNSMSGAVFSSSTDW